MNFASLQFAYFLLIGVSLYALIRRHEVQNALPLAGSYYACWDGFNPDAEDVKALKAMLVDLSRRTKERGERLVVLLLHTRGQSDLLHAVPEGTLKASKIDYISTHTLFSTNDPTNFLPDSHYIPAANRKLANALVTWIRSGSNPSR